MIQPIAPRLQTCTACYLLNTAGKCNKMVSIIILYYNLMETLSYMQFIIDRNIVLQCVTVEFYKAMGCYMSLKCIS